MRPSSLDIGDPFPIRPELERGEIASVVASGQLVVLCRQGGRLSLLRRTPQPAGAPHPSRWSRVLSCKCRAALRRPRGLADPVPGRGGRVRVGTTTLQTEMLLSAHGSKCDVMHESDGRCSPHAHRKRREHVCGDVHTTQTEVDTAEGPGFGFGFRETLCTAGRGARVLRLLH